MDPLPKQVDCHSVMKPARRRDNCRIDLTGDLVMIAVSGDLQLFGDRLPRLRRWIGDADQLDFLKLLSQPGVNLPQMPDANDRHAQLAHAALRKSRLRPLRPRC